MKIVGISLVRNEDRFIRRALLNVAEFCDQIFVADHMSTDDTGEILADLARELDHLEVTRVRHSAHSHALIEPFVGSHTWILSVDGDELFDPVALPRLRRELEQGRHDDVFRVRPAGLHCDELDENHGVARGFLSPPGRPLVGLLNFAAIDSWAGVRSQRLHGGEVVFRPGFGWESWRHLGEEPGWDDSPFRDLHVCFVQRSSRDFGEAPSGGRPNLSETRAFRRGALSPFERVLRRAVRRSPARKHYESQWKAEKYRRGQRVTVDASAFLEAG